MTASANKSFLLGIAAVTAVGLVLRIAFAPDINFETDSFSVLLSAKNIAETGVYQIPQVRLTDHLGYQAFTGWAVGYPLFLAAFFSLFGYGEGLARWATILFCSLPIFLTGYLGMRLHSRRAGFLAALFLSVNPLMVCINGRILTANLGNAFLTASLAFLILSAYREKDPAGFATVREIVSSGRRFLLFAVSFLFFGFTIMTRDDFAMFAPVHIFILFQVVRPVREQMISEWKRSLLLFFTAGASFVAGYLPNFYYNLQTYGKLFTSSHYEYGGRLNFGYFLRGNEGLMGLPGWSIILLTMLVFAFPVIAFFKMPKVKSGALIIWITAVMLAPILVINGAYPVTSSGASPRYILPLIPFISLGTGFYLAQRNSSPSLVRRLFVAGVAVWHILLFFPPSPLFAMVPKTAYLTQYSPTYNKINYVNYPHPVKAGLEWVRTRTPAEAVIVSDYDFFHYRFYTGRDVADASRFVEIKRSIQSRPAYFIESHPNILYPELTETWRKQLADHGLELKEVAALPLFSPVKGPSVLKIYQVTEQAQ